MWFCRKDLLIERRSLVTLAQVLPVTAVLLVVFAFAFNGDAELLRRGAGGVFWVAVLVAAVLLTKRSFDIESENGNTDVTRLSGVEPWAVFAGKAAALAVQLAAVAVVAGFGVIVLYDARVADWPLAVASVVAGLVALCVAGTLYGAMTVGVRAGGTLLALLLLPTATPVLLGGARTLDVALGVNVDGGWSWAALLAIIAVTYLAAGLAAFGPLIEDA